MPPFVIGSRVRCGKNRFAGRGMDIAQLSMAQFWRDCSAPHGTGGFMAEIKHIGSLDGLRGFAASAVVFTHIESIYTVLAPIEIAKVGEQGVAIFFALSGFLMAYLYGSKPFSRPAAADYLVSRFARIYPVYLFAVLVCALLSAWPGLDYIDHLVGPVEIIRHVAMLGSQGVFWSIPPEIQFYLFFLLLWYCFANPQKSQALLAAIACLFAVAALLKFPGPGIMLLSKLPYFLLGALAGRIFALQPGRPTHAAVGIAALLLLAVFVPSRVMGILPKEEFWGLPSALAASVLVYLIACESAITAKIFASAPLRFIGMISFSLYLLHLPVMFLMNRWLGDALPLAAMIPLSIAAAYIAAWVSYRTIETPARRFLVALWHDRRIGLAAAKA